MNVIAASRRRDAMRWTAVLPVEPWNLAKSRLGLPDEDRFALARAFGLDALATLAACPQVDRIVVVTAEGGLAHPVSLVPGAVMLRDRPMLVGDGLNRAIVHACGWATTHAAGSPIVVVPSDLPALTPEALTEALALLARVERGHVPDADGIGTTLASALRPGDLVPAYGPRSAVAFSAVGSSPVPDVDIRVRRDVDRQAHLSQARGLGLGPATAEAVREAADRRAQAS